ncbi:MAG: ATP-binding protein [Planctomycetes bacterium]|nr:ATP-binding protein [Planctomycetota bacterium]MCC7398075.1 ATP-binding protein [Planctomycetota bacterium]
MDREALRSRLEAALRSHPVVALLGMRQVGKTTLAREIVARRRGPTTFLDLEDDRQLARLQEPIAALEPMRGLVVLDEVQRLPGLFRSLRVLADRPGKPARFLVLGSASGDLLQQSAESLAGRVAYLQVSGFTMAEVGAGALDRRWLRGGLPAAFLARNDVASMEWRRQYITTLLERDIPQLGVRVPSTTMRRFWMMLAHWHGQIWNGSEFGSSFGVSHTAVRRYLDILGDAMLAFQLSPWHENITKRQVKSPKVFLADSGLLHALLQLPTMPDLLGHPKVGASWEGAMIQEVVAHLGAHAEERYFWATHAGAELDLLVVRGKRRLGFEFKHTSQPVPTPSMRIAMKELKLDILVVVHAGSESFPLGDGIQAVAGRRLLLDVEPL